MKSIMLVCISEVAVPARKRKVTKCRLASQFRSRASRTSTTSRAWKRPCTTCRAGASEALRALYEKMLRLGGQRFTVKPSALPEMDALFDELPNFAEVLEDIRKHLALCIDTERLGRAAADAAAARRARHRQDALRAPACRSCSAPASASCR